MISLAPLCVTLSAICAQTPTYLSHLWSQVKDPEERARECSVDTLDYTVKQIQIGTQMRENEDLQREDTCQMSSYAPALSLDYSRLLIMQSRDGERSFCVGLEENTKKYIQEDTTKKVLITLTKQNVLRETRSF